MLREIVDIERLTGTLSDEGEQVDTWTALFENVFADIKTPTGREYFAHDRLNAEVTHRVKIRWHDGVTNDMRINWQGRILDILYISEDQTHKQWQYIFCKESK